MTGYLLDTNILSDLIRSPQGMAATQLASISPETICTSVIVAAELRFGATKRGSAILISKVEAILQAIPVLPFDRPADEAYARLRANLERAGRTIGGNDYFIAAHALSADCVLVTDNTREFSRIEGLAVENWIR